MSDCSDDVPPLRSRFRPLTAAMRWVHIYLSMFGFLAILFFAVTGLTLNHPDWFSMGVERVDRLEGLIDPALLGISPYGDGEAVGAPGNSTHAAESAPAVEEPPAVEGAPLDIPPAVAAAAGSDWSAALEAPPSVEQPLPAGRDPGANGEAAVKQEAVVALLRTRHNLGGAVKEFAVDPYQCIVLFKGPAYAADIFIERATGRYELTVRQQDWVALINDLHKGRNTGSAWSGVVDISAALMTISSVTGLVLLAASRTRRRSGLSAAVVGGAIMILAYVLLVP
ncbi:MAG: hypothetical protein GXY83_38560 [Rhodopirellula sp.]|nr:hypothetical protein [Rhodopirellula sp.]